MRGSQLIAGVVVTAVLGMAGAIQACAAGYFNLPGTITQWAGHGYGAGYHAPLILGPIKFDGWHVRHEVRLPSAPCASCACAGCGDGGQMVASPTMMEGVVPTTVAPGAAEKGPTPATDRDAPSSTNVIPKAESTRPLFDPPVQP